MENDPVEREEGELMFRIQSGAARALTFVELMYASMVFGVIGIVVLLILRLT